MNRGGGDPARPSNAGVPAIGREDQRAPARRITTRCHADRAPGVVMAGARARRRTDLQILYRGRWGETRTYWLDVTGSPGRTREPGGRSVSVRSSIARGLGPSVVFEVGRDYTVGLLSGSRYSSAIGYPKGREFGLMR